MAKGRTSKQYFCLAVRRHYETVWRVIAKYDTVEEAQAALEERRTYTGAFNYDNADLRVISREEAKQEFGAKWEYHAIGEKPEPTADKPKRAPRKQTESKVEEA